jgi:hypothetical protein
VHWLKAELSTSELYDPKHVEDLNVIYYYGIKKLCIKLVIETCLLDISVKTNSFSYDSYRLSTRYPQTGAE